MQCEAVLLGRRRRAAFRWWAGLCRLAALGALVDGARVQRVLARWRLCARGRTAAALVRGAVRARAWQGLWRVARRRRACALLAARAAEQLGRRALWRLEEHARRLAELHHGALGRLARRRRGLALQRWWKWARGSALRAVLPRILAAWHQECRVRRLQRRWAMLRGLRLLRGHAARSWALRRRGAIARMLSSRRRLRAAWLALQLHGLGGESLGPEVLIERWSDAVADPAFVRPLAALRSSQVAPPAALPAPRGRPPLPAS